MQKAPMIRHRVDPGDVPADKAARRLHLTLAEFQQKLPRLLARGFPPADPDTGNFDLDAIDLWRKARYPRLYGLTVLPAGSQPVPAENQTSMGDRFVATKIRSRHDRAS